MTKTASLHIQRSINRLGGISDSKIENAMRDILLPPHALCVIEDQKGMRKEHEIATRTWILLAPMGTEPTRICYTSSGSYIANSTA